MSAPMPAPTAARMRPLPVTTSFSRWPRLLAALAWPACDGDAAGPTPGSLWTSRPSGRSTPHGQTVCYEDVPRRRPSRVSGMSAARGRHVRRDGGVGGRELSAYRGRSRLLAVCCGHDRRIDPRCRCRCVRRTLSSLPKATGIKACHVGSRRERASSRYTPSTTSRTTSSSGCTYGNTGRVTWQRPSQPRQSCACSVLLWTDPQSDRAGSCCERGRSSYACQPPEDPSADYSFRREEI